jgi:scyllo-inositol 2-dehydrogenase (NADP+)
MKCVRVGLVGFGFAGRVFQSSVIEAVEGLELAAIVQRKGSEAARAYPHAKIVRSVEELLQDTSIRLVVVATPNATHLPIARQCLLADRDVVIDKPFALSSAEAAELIQLARSRKRLLSVYRQLPRLNAWREDGSAGGGVLFDLGSHLVDQALVLFGVPQAVWANVRVEREGARMNDAFDLCLRYPASHTQAAAGPVPAGLTVWLRATCLAREPGARFTLNGTLGSFRKWGMDCQEAHLMAGDLFSSKPWGVEGPEHWGTLTLDEGGEPACSRIPTEAGDYRGYYINIRDAIHGNAAVEVTPLQAWRTMRVLEMAMESHRTGTTIACDWKQEP